MKGTLVIFLVAVFLLLIVAYLAQDTEPEKRAGSKAYHLLLLGLMRADLALSQGMRYAQGLLARIFKGYPLSGTGDDILRKRQRMEEYRRGSSGGQEYKKRQKYNRKILE